MNTCSNCQGLSRPARQPINQVVVVTTVLRAAQFLRSQKEGPDWMDLGKAIRNNPAAWEEAREFTDAIDADDQVMLAFGFGMVAGMMYAASQFS